MNQLAKTLFLTTVLSTAAFAVPAFAEMGAAKEGTGEAMRDMPMTDHKFQAKPAKPPMIEDEATRAAPITDEKAVVDALGTMTRSADGKVTTGEASEAVRGAVAEVLKGTDKGDNIDAGEEGALGGTRQVFGNDDRVQIEDTAKYPFSAIGYIEGKSKAGYGGCSGTLIGPKTVLTAAHCLYNHDDKDWLSDILFAPGLNTFEKAPYGIYKAESVTILKGFVDNYKDYYGSVVPWDLGIITLAEPVGDTIGYFGYANFDKLGAFGATIVGYPGDKPQGTMWGTSCDVAAENIGTENFIYDCDTYPGSSGSSVYAVEAKTKQRTIVGVNVAETKEFNTAVRLNKAYVEWINSNWQ